MPGCAAAPVAGYMGLLGAIAPGPEGQGADFARRTMDDMTYQPQSGGGQAAGNVASYPAVNGSVLRLGGPSFGRRNYFYLTSRFQILMRNCVMKCAAKSKSSIRPLM